MSIVLTDEQGRTLRSETSKTIDVLDPLTSERYVLIARRDYDRVRPLLEEQTSTGIDVAIPARILSSQQAFWRDLPELLADRANHGKWVCYHGEERIGISGNSDLLLQESLNRGIPDDAYYLAVIRERDKPPWEPEDVEPLGPWHFEDAEQGHEDS